MNLNPRMYHHLVKSFPINSLTNICVRHNSIIKHKSYVHFKYIYICVLEHLTWVCITRYTLINPEADTLYTCRNKRIQLWLDDHQRNDHLNLQQLQKSSHLTISLYAKITATNCRQFDLPFIALSIRLNSTNIRTASSGTTFVSSLITTDTTSPYFRLHSSLTSGSRSLSTSPGPTMFWNRFVMGNKLFFE